jgi:hypothetical protein
MPHHASEIDANFYRLIHELVGPQLEDEPAERRRRERRPFPVDQWIAPRHGPAFPADSQFLKVRCHDLTEGGFSFLVPQAPDFDHLVAAFGDPPNLLYVGAEVRHCHRVLVSPSGDMRHAADPAAEPGPQGQASAAKPMVLVGCRFIERLHKPS